jgi:small subunit ribosomal protein S20
VPNLHSSFKRVKTGAKKAAQNRPIKTLTGTRMINAVIAIREDLPDAAERVRVALSQLDRAVSKGVIHRNNANRRKSRLARKLNALLASKA